MLLSYLRRLVHSNTCTKNKIWQIAVNGNEKQYNLLIYNNTLLKLFMCNCAIQKRTIFSLLLPYNRKSDRKIYRDRKLIGYSPEQIFDVIQDTENYKRFLPFCRQSIVKIRKDNYVKTFLEIGFPPIIENYMSHVTFQRPHVIRAECHEGNLFNHLVTQWNCNPGLNNKSNTCVINFFVSYEFKSQLHSKLTNMFFNELVKQMEQAFFDEAAKRYGQPTIKAQQLKLLPFSEH
ncbi:coenzyme Q-binding protein COQ10 homolog B, mitochondrial isoform X2 [Daktulosphaira vitifoliae]|uniref:coenzyme Q-binding protein COQ10 homolog B, mitochondrial isoform X2 n=1 Tax=Daktulosphaira vitifoliae TaxID=58002 RepID=UPI0021A99440|nr:coenzyme Q-binding protein COQ10 homolog B, mitochondrial isoform X2 [Daktulosphaira vitifoliae]